MTKRFLALATALQDGVRADEERQINEGIDYSDQYVRLATVHSRQDLVLVVSYLRSLNEAVGAIKFLLIAILAVLMLSFAIDVGLVPKNDL